ncbi:alkylhydroperoxidase [Acidihalobacter yilgarnensis]|uniref:Alkylhydroperoxidase n=1 Tax=Acidihalobacter yilgarnensis TaxID=2819280 RepID=A0A1D8INB0_9GAMM|nr:carboxymuconolactone decarboxylase family protein [Acidihalobacter yilgarnensis]AOU97960.1 alkylhydroperoxidase [Acidihalobacter yilgarnensis]
MNQTAKLKLYPQTLGNPDPSVRRALEKAKKANGFIPNMYANMANSPGLLESYLDAYARFRQASGFTPAEQETVFLTISLANGCDYCTAAHSFIAEKMSQVPEPVLQALRARKPIPDDRLAALTKFTQIMVDTRGRPTESELNAFRATGFTDRHALEIIHALAIKTLSNYSNHLLHTEIDEMFLAYKVDSAA